MYGIMERFIHRIDALNNGIGRAVAWLTAVLVAVVCLDVATSLLRHSFVALKELSWHLFAVIFLIGAGFTLRHDRHVRVDVFYTRLSPKGQAWVNLIGTVLFLIPFMVVAIFASVEYVSQSFLLDEQSPDPGGLPARWLLKACIPLGCALLLLQGVALAMRSVRTLLDREEG